MKCHVGLATQSVPQWAQVMWFLVKTSLMCLYDVYDEQGDGKCDSYYWCQCMSSGRFQHGTNQEHQSNIQMSLNAELSTLFFNWNPVALQPSYLWSLARSPHRQLGWAGGQGSFSLESGYQEPAATPPAPARPATTLSDRVGFTFIFNNSWLDINYLENKQ